MGIIENVCALAVQIAEDNTHGYSQYNRDGNPDFDCSSLVIYLWTRCGVDVARAVATYTGNMLNAFLSCGFRKVNPAIETLQAGDVLLNVVHHAAQYIGNGQLVQATISEKGKIDGQPGDQTGTEIGIFKYYDYPWNYVLRYEPKAPEPKPSPCPEISYTEEDCVSVMIPELTRGEWGSAVAAMQAALRYHGFYLRKDIDGYFDAATETALIDFQRKHNLERDGICGVKTWHELMFWN